jgi:hypothetical protein
LRFLTKTRVYAQHNNFSHSNQRCKKEEHDKTFVQTKKWTELVGSYLQLECECCHHTKRFHYKRQSVQSSHNHLTHNASDPSNESSWSLTPKLFLILMVITLHQTWPLFFLSMPCILEEHEHWEVKATIDYVFKK